MKWVGKILCFLGFHRWFYHSKRVQIIRVWLFYTDSKPMWVSALTRRVCTRCNKEQEAHYPTGDMDDPRWYDKEELKQLRGDT